METTANHTAVYRTHALPYVVLYIAAHDGLKCKRLGG